MSIRPRTLVPFVVVAILLVSLAACSDSPASIKDAADDPSTKGTEPTEDAPCAATATVDNAAYHVVQVMSQDYGVKPTVQKQGFATGCDGGTAQPTTFHAIPHVDPAWALCGLVDGQWRVFLSDQLAQVPAGSELAHIVVGK